MGIAKTFTCCISPFFISGSSTPNYPLLSSLVVKLLFHSAVDDVVTILFVYSTSYFIAIWSMGRVTLVPNSPLNGWERDGDQIVEGLKGHWRMSECGLWMSLFNLTRWDGVHLEDEVDIRLEYGWNQYRCVLCGRYSINLVLMSKIRYCSIWCHSNSCLRSSKHGESKGWFWRRAAWVESIGKALWMGTVPRPGVRWEHSSRESCQEGRDSRVIRGG